MKEVFPLMNMVRAVQDFEKSSNFVDQAGVVWIDTGIESGTGTIAAVQRNISNTILLDTVHMMLRNLKSDLNKKDRRVNAAIEIYYEKFTEEDGVEFKEPVICFRILGDSVIDKAVLCEKGLPKNCCTIVRMGDIFDDTENWKSFEFEGAVQEFLRDLNEYISYLPIYTKGVSL